MRKRILQNWFLSAGTSDPSINSLGQQAILTIGDSTSVGSNNNTGVGPTPNAGTVFRYKRSTNEIVEIGANDIFDSPGTLGSQWPQFGIDRYNDSGIKPVIIVSGVGASSVYPIIATGTNNWSSSGANYALAVSDVAATLSLLGTTKLGAIIISQLSINDARISDAGNSIANVLAAMDDLIDRLQDDFPGVDILIEQPGTSNRTDSTYLTRLGAFQTKWKNICNENSNCYLIGGMISLPGIGGLTPNNSIIGIGNDNLHPNQLGNNERGKMIARWFKNSSYSKWPRSIISSFYDDISDSRKTLISQWFDSVGLSWYLSRDGIYVFKNTIRENTFVDWSFRSSPGVILTGFLGDGGYGFTANSHISTNGSSTYFKTGLCPTQNTNYWQVTDQYSAVKIKTNNTPAGTYGVAFGRRTTDYYMISQETTNKIKYHVSDIANTFYASDAKIQDNTEYATARDASGKYLYKNGAIVSGPVVASTRTLGNNNWIVGAWQSGASAVDFLAIDAEYAHIGDLTNANPVNTKSAFDTLISNW